MIIWQVIIVAAFFGAAGWLMAKLVIESIRALRDMKRKRGSK